MRKHRLAECLLVGVIKLPWEEVHIEACRWEHVISESVERRLLELLGYPVRCPHGNLIPGLAELGLPGEAEEKARAAMNETGEAMTKAASGDSVRAVIRRIGEQIQSDLDLMLKLKRVGIQPGREVILMAGDDGVRVMAGEEMDAISTELPSAIAAHIFVTIYRPAQPARRSVIMSFGRSCGGGPMTGWNQAAFDPYLPADMVLGQADIGVVVADRLSNLLYINEFAARLFRHFR